MIDLIRDWHAHRPGLEAKAAAGGGVLLSSVKLEAPVRRPGKIFAIGLNYADHIAESKAETPPNQVWFTKAQTSINGPHDPILIAKTGPFVDYEVELVAVIGKGGRSISKADAYRHVFGYCVGNDVTERVWQHRTPQWSLGKSFDTHAPIGPWITTADEIADPHALGLRCFVNGEKRQESNSKHLVFNIWDQIEHLSQAMTLEPGDLIFTGTPGGVGVAMDPRQFLKPGDMVRCEVDGLGHIEGVLAAED
ncbi:MAG: fumarylacetoacetate hydrolase family protein [Hyphomonadaceae bacterium JAD_PAG50586_4]|nr:MAG: fumarylacetoacetate hydrolase family protein [Hyphomonadaceae bacterium JAD_PAG50586_4]